jgi:O-antigen/teichoic acid export membrane protein
MDEVARSVGEVSQWLIVTNIPLCASLMILAEPVLELLGGSPTPDNVDMLRVLAVAACVEIIATPATNALPGIGRIGTTAWPAVLGLVLAALVWWLGMERWGLLGIVAGLLVSSIVKGGVPIFAARALMNLRLTRTPKMVFGFLVISLACIFLVEQWERPWVVFAFYSVCIAFLGRKAWAELWTFGREQLAKRAG